MTLHQIYNVLIIDFILKIVFKFKYYSLYRIIIHFTELIGTFYEFIKWVIQNTLTFHSDYHNYISQVWNKSRNI